MANLNPLRIALWIAVAAVLQSGYSASINRYEATINFKEFNHRVIEESSEEIQTIVEKHERILEQKLQVLFQDPALSVDVFNVIESGHEQKLPTLSVQVVIESAVVQSRDAFLKTFESKLDQFKGLFLFALGPATSSSKNLDKSGLHAFHEKFSRAAGECLNRGIMLPNKTCVCQPYYSGSDCSVQTCLNSGIISQAFRCSCPPGFVGRHCEQMACMAAYNSEFDFNKKSFVLILNIKQGSTFLLSRVVQQVQQVLPARALLFANFVISTYYTDTTAGVAFSYTVTAPDYPTYLNLLDSVVKIHVGDDAQPTLTAINTAIQRSPAMLPKADIYVVTSSLLSDYDASSPYVESSTTAESLLTRTLISWQHSVYFLMTQNSLKPFNESDPSIAAFNNIAAISNGEYVYTSADASAAGSAFAAVFRYNFQSETIAVRRGFDCSAATTFTVTVGPYDSGLFLYTSGAGITVTNGGVPVPVNGSFANFQVFPVILNTTATPSATLTLSGTATSCSYRAFTSSAETVVLGYSKNSQLIDVSSSYPVASIPSYPVSRMVSSGKQIGMQMAAYALNDPTNQISNFGGVGGDPDPARADCNFQNGFTQWPSCVPGPFAAVFKYTADIPIPQVTDRVRPSACFSPTPRDPSTVPLNCNGGTPNANNTCSCLPNLTGQYCQTVVCQNGGSANLFPGNGSPSCYCLAGFSGDFCQNMVCNSTGARPDTSLKTLSLVAEATVSLGYYKGLLAQGLSGIVNDPSGGGFYHDYLLTTFANASSETVQTKDYTTIADFNTAISGINSAFNADGQTQNVFTGLLQALSTRLDHPWQQTLFLITDSMPGDAILATQAINTAVNQATAVNVILVKPYGLEGDSSVSCIADSSIYRQLADATGGIFVSLCNNPQDLAALITEYGRLLYNAQVVSRQYIDCSTSATIPIEANDGIQTRYVFFITNTAANYTLAYTDPTGVPVTSVINNGVSGAYIHVATALNQRGNYSVAIAPAGMVPGMLQCLVIVAEPAGQTILAAFTTNPSVDFSTFAATLGMPQHPAIFMSTQLQSPPTVTLSFSGNQTEPYMSTAVVRDPNTCQFDYYFLDPFACPIVTDPNTGATVTGQSITINARFTTSDGVSFSRSIQSVCQGPSPGTCLNGGYTTTDVPFLCTCPVGYQGQFCETTLCYNGGSLIQGQCVCAPGYVGTHCSVVQCKNWDFMAALDTNAFAYETIAFVVNTNTFSLIINSYLSTSIQDFINNVNVQAHPKQFVLVTFDDVSVTKVVSTTDPTYFVNTLKAAVTQPSGAVQPATVKTIDAIYETYKLLTYKPAVLYVFSSNEPAAYNIFGYSAMFGSGVQVNHVYSGAYPLPTSGGYYYLYQTAIPTGGRLLFVEAAQMTNFVSNYLASTVFENVVIEDVTFANCFAEKWVYFPVENRAKWITITIRATRANTFTYIYDAANQNVSLSQFVTFNSAGTVSYTIPATATQNFAGYWRVLVEAADHNQCQVRVTAATPVETSIGFTLDETDDFPHKVSYTGPGTQNRTRYITVGAASALYQQRDVYLEYIKVSLSDDVEAASSSVVLAAPLRQRNGQSCSYQFVSPLFDIPLNGARATGSLRVQVNGQDEKGQNFQQIRWLMPSSPICAHAAATDMFGYCICPSTYTGDDCTVPICQNGGTADMAVCNCLSGFYGDFCEQRVLAGNTTSW